jgi:phosphatidylserine decarboxylase
MKKNYGKDRAWIFAEGGTGNLAIVVAFVAVAVLLWRIWPQSFLLDILLFIAALVAMVGLYFFRDPNRLIRNEVGTVLSPADGKVVAIVKEHEPLYLQENVCRISIFLSVLDVHVQRAPVDGEVTLVEHRPGQYLQAYKPEASEVNEYIAMIIDSAYGRILVKQIAGILARRCVNYAEVGEEVKAGQRFGLIRFGSRVDLFLPTTAEIMVQLDDHVYGGLTPIARFPQKPSPDEARTP